MENESKYELIREFRIFESDEGELKRPEEYVPYGYGDTQYVFGDFESLEAAKKSYMDCEHFFGEVIVVPVLKKQFKY